MSAKLGEHVSSSTVSAHQLARAGVALEFTQACASEEVHGGGGWLDVVEYVECDARWWGCQWVQARQRYCWWLAAEDGSRLGKVLWRHPWAVGQGWRAAAAGEGGRERMTSSRSSPRTSATFCGAPHVDCWQVGLGSTALRGAGPRSACLLAPSPT